jgi:hypothetical protein
MNCPKCREALTENNFCPNCKIAICPKCGEYRDHENQISWPKTFLYAILFPIILVLILIDFILTGGVASYFSLRIKIKCFYCNHEFRT